MNAPSPAPHDLTHTDDAGTITALRGYGGSRYGVFQGKSWNYGLKQIHDGSSLTDARYAFAIATGTTLDEEGKL